MYSVHSLLNIDIYTNGTEIVHACTMAKKCQYPAQILPLRMKSSSFLGLALPLSLTSVFACFLRLISMMSSTVRQEEVKMTRSTVPGTVTYMKASCADREASFSESVVVESIVVALVVVGDCVTGVALAVMGECVIIVALVLTRGCVTMV